MIKFILDAMYYQIFIFNRDKFILENPHERTIQIICGILFLPVIVLTYLLIKENFNYKTPFVFFIIIYVLLYKTFCSYYICLLYTSPSPRDYAASRMPSSA